MKFAKLNIYLITQYVAKQRIITSQTLYHMLHRVTNRYYPMWYYWNLLYSSAKVEIIDRRRAGAAGGSSGQEQEACDEARHGRRQGREARTSGRRRTEYKGGVKRQYPRSRTRHDTINSGSILNRRQEKRQARRGRARGQDAEREYKCMTRLIAAPRGHD